MTGKDIIDYIKKHKLQNAEVDEYRIDFAVLLEGEAWIYYSLDEYGDNVKYFEDGDSVDSVCEHISHEEAMNIRFPKKESLQPRRYRIKVPNGNYTVPETLMASITDAFRERFSDLCSEPGKRSPYKEKISFYEDIIYVLATKENFNKILEQIEYERIPSVPPVGKTYYIFKGFKEERVANG